MVCRREGLANLLASAGDFDVLAQADDGRAAVRLWREHRPDVCLLDLTMHGIDGIETLRLLREADPRARVLRLTSSDSAGIITKLGVSDRTQAVARAFDLGLLAAKPPGSAAAAGTAPG